MYDVSYRIIRVLMERGLEPYKPATGPEQTTAHKAQQGLLLLNTVTGFWHNGAPSTRFW